jgi:hypothetical protein
MESELDRQIEHIIGKMVKGTETPEEIELFKQLCRRRASLMRSTPFTRSERIRRRAMTGHLKTA